VIQSRLDRLVALATAAICLAVMSAGWGMRGDAGLFPLITGTLGVLASAWLGLAGHKPPTDTEQAPACGNGQRLVLWSAGVVLLLALMEPVGTFIVVPLFLVATFRWLAGLRWAFAFLLAGSFTLAIYIVFAWLLSVPLPAGWLAS